MTKQEAVETIRMAIAQVEWEYPMDYAVALDMALKALNEPEIVRCRDCTHRDHCELVDGFGKSADWFCADGGKE